MFYQRNLYATLLRAAKNIPVVLLTGARQTGKTTLVQYFANLKNIPYYSFDDLRLLSAARSDPIGFIQGLPKPVVIDEFQRVAEVLLPIKQDVDKNRSSGRYFLTGSVNPFLFPKTADSLVGRLWQLNLYPFSQGELHQTKEKWIDLAFKGLPPPSSFNPLTKESLAKILTLGGYPPLPEQPDGKNKEMWCENYLGLLLQKDVQDLARIDGLKDLPNLLALLATRAGKMLNIAELSRTSKISNTTLHRYLQLLKALFLIDFLPAWSMNLGKRLVKSPKLFLIDSGLLAFLMGMNHEGIEARPTLFGNLVENFIISEIIKQTSWCDESIHCYHMRTQTRYEVDLILENRAKEIIGIEIKSSYNVSFNDFKALYELKNLIPQQFKSGIVLYLGDKVIPFGEKLYALPITSLWEWLGKE